MVACTAQDTRVATEGDLSLANLLFQDGYQDIMDIYIDEVDASDLALAGLDNLTDLDPDISVLAQGGLVTVKLDGQAIGNFAAPSDQDTEAWGDLTASALRLGRSHSAIIDEADPEEIYEVVFDGILTELDKFSRYAGREEARENRASRDGFGGIGVRIRLIDEGVRILSVMDNTPAERAGLEDNDIIVEIDGESTVSLNQRETAEDVLGRLVEGSLPIDRATQHRDVDPDDEAGIAALRAYCPARQSDSGIDLEVALRLFERPDLFARAIGAQAPDTALLDEGRSADASGIQ